MWRAWNPPGSPSSSCSHGLPIGPLVAVGRRWRPTWSGGSGERASAAAMALGTLRRRIAQYGHVVCTVALRRTTPQLVAMAGVLLRRRRHRRHRRHPRRPQCRDHPSGRRWTCRHRPPPRRLRPPLTTSPSPLHHRSLYSRPSPTTFLRQCRHRTYPSRPMGLPRHRRLPRRLLRRRQSHLLPRCCHCGSGPWLRLPTASGFCCQWQCDGLGSYWLTRYRLSSSLPSSAEQ